MPLLGERGQHLQGLHVEIAALRTEQEQEEEIQACPCRELDAISAMAEAKAGCPGPAHPWSAVEHACRLIGRGRDVVTASFEDSPRTLRSGQVTVGSPARTSSSPPARASYRSTAPSSIATQAAQHRSGRCDRERDRSNSILLCS